MALLGQDEDKQKPRFGLPSIESVRDIGTAGEEKRGVAVTLLDGTLMKQISLNNERTADALKDVQFIDQVSAAESQAQADEAKERATLTSGLQSGLDDLEAAENMNPFERSLRAIFNPNVKPSVIRKKLAIDQDRLKLFQGRVKVRQQQSVRALTLFDKRNISEEASFAARQKGIDSRMKLASQYSTLAQQELTAGIKKIEFTLKIRTAQRVERSDILSRMSDDMITQLEEQAIADPKGAIDVAGVPFTVGDFEAQRKSRTKINTDLANAQIALASGQDDLGQTNFVRALEGMTLGQLQQTAQDNGLIQLGDGKQAQVPPALVSQELGKRLKQRSENLELSTDFDEAVGSATVELNIYGGRVNSLVPRLNSFSGANSGLGRRLAEDIARNTVKLNALAGVTGESTVDLETLTQASAEGLISEDNMRRIGKTAASANQSLEAMVKKVAESQFEDPSTRQTFENFLNGDSSSPAASIEALVRMSVGRLPRGVTRDSAIGLAMEAGNTFAQGWLQKNLVDAPDFASMEPEERTNAMIASLFDNKGVIKPDNLGMLAQMSSAIYDTWLGHTVDNMLVNAVSIPDSPAFGLIDPSVIQSSLQQAQRQSQEQVTNQDAPADQNQAAIIEATTFIRLLRGVRVGKTNAADLYLQQLDSPAFQVELQQKALGGNAASWPGYLLDNGAIQGNFTSDFASLISIYKRVNADLTAEAGQRRANLSELFSDPNEQDLAAFRIAGFLEGGADPEAVNAFVDEMIEQHGGDADAIWETVNNERFKNQAQENIRKAIVKAKAQRSPMMNAIFSMLNGLASTTGTTQQRLGKNIPSIATREAILNQETFSIFPTEEEER